jgi:hypothetical protein
MKTNQLLMSAVILALSLNAQANETVAEEPTAASQPAVIAPSAVQYDADYMDEGVRVIIPRILPRKAVSDRKIIVEPKVYGKFHTQIDQDFDLKMISEYKAGGYEADFNGLFNSGYHIGQSLAYVGSKEELLALNQGYGRASTTSKWLAGAVNVAGGVVGAVVGNRVGGSFGAGALGGSLGTMARSSDGLKKLKPAIFDGAQSIPAHDGDIISVYGVWSDGESNQGNIIFITNMTGVENDAVVIRAIMKAQNIVKH